MDLRRLLKLFLAIFVTIGLSVAPVVTPAAAKPVGHDDRHVGDVWRHALLPIRTEE